MTEKKKERKEGEKKKLPAGKQAMAVLIYLA